MDNSMSKFIKKELSTRAALKRVFNSWVYLRDISFSKNTLKIFLKNFSRLDVFLGTQDTLIKTNEIIPFLTGKSYTILKEKRHKIPIHPAVLTYIQNIKTNPCEGVQQSKF